MILESILFTGMIMGFLMIVLAFIMNFLGL